MTKKELERNLKTIVQLIDERMDAKTPILLHNAELLVNLRTIAIGSTTEETVKEVTLTEKAPSHVILSCDAFTTGDPKGLAAVGYVIRSGQKNQDIVVMGKVTSAITSSQAGYDAIYEALMTLFGLKNYPSYKVEVRSSSLLVVHQLNGNAKCENKTLQRKRNAILEYVKHLPVPIEFVWMPRNSTSDLESANYHALDLLGVSNH